MSDDILKLMEKRRKNKNNQTIEINKEIRRKRKRGGYQSDAVRLKNSFIMAKNLKKKG